MNNQLALAPAWLMVSLLLTQAQAQPPGKKAYDFRGKVVQVDVSSRRLTVANEPIEGWMGAMTMSYVPDKGDVLKNLKIGDEITAKVYDGDFHTLYDVHVVPAKK